MGRAFGTIGCRKGPWQVEITTYRSETYDPASRKPDVDFGDHLADDLGRRDFTVNAMAVRVPGREFVDPFGGIVDLAERVLRTPGAPEDSFGDDPLRMMRAARFAAQLGFAVAPEVVAAMIAMAEPDRDHLGRAGPRRAGQAVCTRTRDSASRCWSRPASPPTCCRSCPPSRSSATSTTATRTSTSTPSRCSSSRSTSSTGWPTSGPDFVARFAALMHDVGKPRTRRFESGGTVTFHHHDVVGAKLTRKRMQALRFSNHDIEAVSTLVELHLRFHGYGSGEWTDSAVRRYVRDAGPQLERLHILTRADCTTRNQRKADRLRRSYDSLEERIARLGEEEELASIRPDLDGNQIMEILGVGPGREVGEAYAFLLELRMEEGPKSPEEAEAALRAWWSARSA